MTFTTLYRVGDVISLPAHVINGQLMPAFGQPLTRWRIVALGYLEETDEDYLDLVDADHGGPFRLCRQASPRPLITKETQS
jgi:hypothetical protein